MAMWARAVFLLLAITCISLCEGGRKGGRRGGRINITKGGGKAKSMRAALCRGRHKVGEKWTQPVFGRPMTCTCSREGRRVRTKCTAGVTGNEKSCKVNRRTLKPGQSYRVPHGVQYCTCSKEGVLSCRPIACKLDGRVHQQARTWTRKKNGLNWRCVCQVTPKDAKAVCVTQYKDPASRVGNEGAGPPQCRNKYGHGQNWAETKARRNYQCVCTVTATSARATCSHYIMHVHSSGSLCSGGHTDGQTWKETSTEGVVYQCKCVTHKSRHTSWCTQAEQQGTSGMSGSLMLSDMSGGGTSVVSRPVCQGKYNVGQKWTVRRGRNLLTCTCTQSGTKLITSCQSAAPAAPKCRGGYEAGDQWITKRGRHTFLCTCTVTGRHALRKCERGATASTTPRCRGIYGNGRTWTEKKDDVTFQCTCTVTGSVARTRCTSSGSSGGHGGSLMPSPGPRCRNQYTHGQQWDDVKEGVAYRCTCTVEGNVARTKCVYNGGGGGGGAGGGAKCQNRYTHGQQWDDVKEGVAYTCTCTVEGNIARTRCTTKGGNLELGTNESPKCRNQYTHGQQWPDVQNGLPYICTCTVEGTVARTRCVYDREGEGEAMVPKCRSRYLHGQRWSEVKEGVTYQCTCTVEGTLAKTKCTSQTGGGGGGEPTGPPKCRNRYVAGETWTEQKEGVTWRCSCSVVDSTARTTCNVAGGGTGGGSSGGSSGGTSGGSSGTGGDESLCRGKYGDGATWTEMKEGRKMDCSCTVEGSAATTDCVYAAGGTGQGTTPSGGGTRNAGDLLCRSQYRNGATWQESKHGRVYQCTCTVSEGSANAVCAFIGGGGGDTGGETGPPKCHNQYGNGDTWTQMKEELLYQCRCTVEGSKAKTDCTLVAQEMKCRDQYRDGEIWTEVKEGRNFRCTCTVSASQARASCTVMYEPTTTLKPAPELKCRGQYHDGDEWTEVKEGRNYRCMCTVSSTQARASCTAIYETSTTGPAPELKCRDVYRDGQVWIEVKEGRNFRCRCTVSATQAKSTCTAAYEPRTTERSIVTPAPPRGVCRPGSTHCMCGTSQGMQGAYHCRCKEGYRPLNQQCIDDNECLKATSPCHQHADCVNTEGSFKCRCKLGFCGTGFTCADMNECAMNVHKCDRRAECINTPGSYRCRCPPGYGGDGRACYWEAIVGVGTTRSPPPMDEFP